MSQIVNLVAERGDTFVLYVNVTVDGIAKDITGWIFFLTIKINEDDPDTSAVIQKNVDTHPDPTNGRTVILVAAADMNDLAGDYYYDIQYKDTYGVISTPINGTITFVRDITRRVTA